jgi:hypothetical protein
VFQFLNDNAGAITALATLTLAVLTFFYLRATHGMAKAVRDQADLELRMEDAEKLQRRLAFQSLAIRLAALVNCLPTENEHILNRQPFGLWTEHDLRELEHLVHLVKPESTGRTLAAVLHLRSLTDRAERLRTAVHAGWGMDDFPWVSWKADVAIAGDMLAKLIDPVGTGAET